MAKRHHKTKKHHSRRRRVGAIGGDGMKMIIGAVAGAVAAGFASSKLATVDSKIKNGAMVVAGFLLTKNSNPMIKGAALGIAAIGGVGLVKDTGIISGAPMMELDRVSGFNSYPNNPQLNAIAGFNQYVNNPQQNVISGVSNPAAYNIAAGAGLA